MSTVKSRQKKTRVQTFFKVIKPTLTGGWVVVEDHLTYDEAEHLAELNPGAILRFSSYAVARLADVVPEELPVFTTENSQVVPVFSVSEAGEYGIDVIGVDLEYSDAIQLQASRKSALIEFSGYRRVPWNPPMPDEPQQYRERRAEFYNRANAITYRLFMLPLITVVLLAVLVVLKTMGVLS